MPNQTKRILADEILRHPNSLFVFSSPTGGTARAALVACAQGKLSYCAATGGYVELDVGLLGATLEICKHGPVYINCITNGRHMAGSEHYKGHAKDEDLGSPVGVGTIVQVNGQFGGARNSESDHIHTDFWGRGYLPAWFHVVPPDPLRVLLKDEHNWVREYIKLAAKNQNVARRKKLRKHMRQRMKGIERKAHTSGWDRENRKLRWHLLRRYGK